MTDKEINTNKYFVELTDIGGGTIGYTVPFPEELLREIIKQNKQLKRKEQELETICKAFDIEYGYDEETGAIVGRCNKLIEKEKVLDKYKQSVDEKNKFLQDLGILAGGEFKRIKFYFENLKNKYDEKAEECEELISEKDFYLQKIAVLEQECEELKEENQKLEMQLCNDCGEKDDYNIPCKMIRDLDYGLQKEIEENDRYRKALEEIEQVINNILNSCLGRNTVGCRPAHNVCGDLIKILNIINKVKGEVNESINSL